jgi:hypothetical protein
MESEKIVLLPIPTGWRDSNSPMGDGLSTIFEFLQKIIITWSSLLRALLKKNSVWRENAFRSISAFLIDYICDKPLMVDRVSSMGVLIPVSNSPMGSKTIFLHFKDIKCSVCVKIASVSKYGGSNSTDE